MSSRQGKRLAAALLSVALLAPALGGCGGQSEESAVRATAMKFFDAVHERDFKTVCDLFSQTALEGLPKGSKGGCEQFLSKAATARTDATVKVGDARVRDGRATVTASVSRPGTAPTPLEVLLVKEGGSWKVASPL